MTAPHPPQRQFQSPTNQSSTSRSEREQPMHQRDPYGGLGDVWNAIQVNQQRISDVELGMTRAFGQLSTQIATLSTSVENLKTLVVGKVDRGEEQVRWRWDDERYQGLQGHPAELRAQRGLYYQADQTRTYHVQTWLLGLTLVLSPILSVIAAKFL